MKPDPLVIRAAADVLQRGGVLIYPTDTCYGIGVDGRSEVGRAKIAAIKQRDAVKPFSVIARDRAQIEGIAELNDQQRAILDTYLPGPFTFILLSASRIFSTSSTIGVRIPDYPLTQLLAETFGEPFISTSANAGGQPALYSFAEIQERFLTTLPDALLPDLCLDAGELPMNLPSTVVDLTQKPPKVIRQGGIPFTWPMKS